MTADEATNAEEVEELEPDQDEDALNPDVYEGNPEVSTEERNNGGVQDEAEGTVSDANNVYEKDDDVDYHETDAADETDDEEASN